MKGWWSSAEIWLDRADRSLRQAEVTLNDGDPNGACGLACYAMSYAAKAALLAAGRNEAPTARTRSGLIAAFHQHLVETGEIGAAHGRHSSTEASRRPLASYQGDTIDSQAAAEATRHATAFIAVVRHWATSRPVSVGGNGPSPSR